MSNVGMLQPDHVIFYHPLNSGLLEYTTQEVWRGEAASVQGVVGPALSAVTSTDFEFGVVSNVVDGTLDFQNSPMNIVSLDSETVVATWADSLDQKGKARVGKITGSSVAWGPIAIYRTSQSMMWGMRQNEVASIGSDKIVVGYSNSDSPTGGYVRIANVVSGNMLLFGDEYQFASVPMNGEIRTIAIDDDVVGVYWRNGALGTSQVIIGTVSGTTVSFGDATTPNEIWSFTSEHGMDMVALTPTTIVAANEQSDVINVGTVSGTTVTWGADTSINETQQTWIDMERLSDTEVILASTSAWSGGIEIGTVSGSTITMSVRQSYHDLRANAVDMSLLSSGKVATAFTDQNNDNRIVVLDIISGVVSKDVSSIYGVKSRTPVVTRIDDSTFMTGGQIVGDAGKEGDAYISYGALNSFASISGGLLAYPSINGFDKIVYSMWAKKLTTGTTVVSVERGYKLSVTPSSITLGDGGVSWTGSAISGLLSSSGINDTLSHSIVFDFEHTASGSWQFKTSVDGASFINHGSQTAGSLSVILVDTIPRLSLIPGDGSDQWIDELIMWGGDKTTFTSFTDEELFILHSLVATYSRSAEKYQDLVDEMNPTDPDPDPDNPLCPLEGEHKFKEFTSTVTLSIKPGQDGVIKTDVSKIFNKNIPFRGEVVSVSAVMKKTDVNAFDGIGGSLKILVENTMDVDTSPLPPPSQSSWGTLVEEVECSSVEKGGICFDAPADGINKIVPARSVMPRWSSIRATLTGKVDADYDDNSGVNVQIRLTVTLLTCRHVGGGTVAGIWGSNTLADQS